MKCKRELFNAPVQKRNGINALAVGPDLIMDMRTGRNPGRAGMSDYLSPFDRLPRMDQILRIVSIHGTVTVTMFDNNYVAITAAPFGKADHPVCSCVKRRPIGKRDVHPGVEFSYSVLRVLPHPESGTEPPRRRPPLRGREVDVLLLGEIIPDTLYRFG